MHVPTLEQIKFAKNKKNSVSLKDALPVVVKREQLKKILIWRSL